LIFDLETVLDTELLRDIYNSNESDSQLIARFKSENSKFPAIIYHKIVSVSFIFLQDNGNITIHSKCDNNEESLIKTLLFIIDTFKPILVTWNGIIFDLPVLQYRMLKYSISSPSLMDTGTLQRDNKWDNYRSRYQERHMDLADLMSNRNGNLSSLHNTSLLIGLPGKMGIGGSSVEEYFLRKEYIQIADYNLIDVINTTLIYLRYSEIVGNIGKSQTSNILKSLRTDLVHHGLSQSYFSELDNGRFIKHYQ
jgi:predicted PolB exonuclease-like 3'-5' exonuclease